MEAAWKEEVFFVSLDEPEVPGRLDKEGLTVLFANDI